MKYQIDQSGKIEYTSHNTVIAFSNSSSRSILISAREKRIIQTFFREANKPDIFIFKTFSILIYLLIKDKLDEMSTIVIDKEYKGRESLIKKYLIELIRRGGAEFEPENIHFAQVGKKSSAHKKAISVFRKKEKADLKVSHQDILQWIV